MVRSYKNQFTLEPYQRLSGIAGQAMQGLSQAQEAIDILENVNFQKFMAFKEEFFKKLKF